MYVQYEGWSKVMTNITRDLLEINKGNRLQIRIDDESYHLLEKAANYSRESLSRFVRNASLKKAHQVIYRYESLHLADDDWDAFLQALTHPPLPNEDLKKAFVEYKKILP